MRHFGNIQNTLENKENNLTVQKEHLGKIEKSILTTMQQHLEEIKTYSNLYMVDLDHTSK